MLKFYTNLVMQYETTIEFKLLIDKYLYSQYMKRQRIKRALCKRKN
jgi:hypothetical protein